MSAKLTIAKGSIRAILNTPGVRKEVAAFADTMAGRLSGRVIAHDGPARIVRDNNMTDRLQEGVTIAHPGGVGMEADHGYLRAAARDVGLTPKAKK